jgi:N-acetylglucosaminyldiphosphoundecaprenol N-acetyl-beta-D-mannosaminyltransferase
MESQDNPELKRIHNAAGMVTPDGMPMVWANKLRGNGHVSRVYGPDLMLRVCAEGVAKGYRHFFMGGAEGVADLLAKKLSEKFPGMQVVGTFCPPFRKMTDEEDRALVEQINCLRAPTSSGLACPRPSRNSGWIRTSASSTRRCWWEWGPRSTFHAGLKKQAPRWMQKSGLEWFFRLCTEPRRLWKRYLKNNPRFVWHFALQSAGLRKYD